MKNLKRAFYIQNVKSKTEWLISLSGDSMAQSEYGTKNLI